MSTDAIIALIWIGTGLALITTILIITESRGKD